MSAELRLHSSAREAWLETRNGKGGRAASLHLKYASRSDMFGNRRVHSHKLPCASAEDKRGIKEFS